MEELASLLAESRELALRRFELLRPYLVGLLSLRSVVKDQGIPYRTAARWRLSREKAEATRVLAVSRRNVWSTRSKDSL